MDNVQWKGTWLPRWVAPLLKEPLWRVPTEEKKLFFTFDDGPFAPMTARLMDLFARYDGQATFFVLGQQARYDPGIVQALAEAGHTVGNHTYTHLDAWRTAPQKVVRELEDTTHVLQDTLQQTVRWMRPPHGRFTPSVLRWCRENYQRCAMWDVGPGDYLPSAKADEVTRRTFEAIRPGSIIVLHEGPKVQATTLKAVEEILARLSGQDWTFAAL